MCSCSGAVTDRANLINDGANQNGLGYGTTSNPATVTVTAVAMSANERLASRVEVDPSVFFYFLCYKVDGHVVGQSEGHQLSRMCESKSLFGAVKLPSLRSLATRLT